LGHDKKDGHGALEVSEDTLDNSEMGLTRIMHVKTHLLDCIGDVRPGEGKLLESPDQALGDSRVTNRGPCVGGYIDLSIHEHGTRLVVGHTNTIKDIQSVLELLQEEFVGSLLH
jgi:hypothetical protein